MKIVGILLVAIFLIFLQSFSISIYLIGFLELKIKRRQFFIICFILVLLTKISITNGDIFPNIDLRYIIFIVIGSLIYFCFYGSIQKKFSIIYLLSFYFCSKTIYYLYFLTIKMPT